MHIFDIKQVKHRTFNSAIAKGTTTALILSIFLSPLTPLVHAQPVADVDSTESSPSHGVPASDAVHDVRLEADTTAPDQQKEKGTSPGLDVQSMSLGSTSDDPDFNRYAVTPASKLPQAEVFTGALVYKVPIIVPPGRNGLHPELSLVYNSQKVGPHSILGSGWDIDIPRIWRFNKRGTEGMFDDDTYFSSLDGELVHDSGSTYTPKIDNGERRSYSLTGGSWTVAEKDGTLLTFGQSANTRQDDPADSSNVYAWFLEEVRDPNDDYITYSYVKDGGQVYPDTITYTGHATTDGIFTVEFDRETRPDIATTSDTGFKIVTKYRVSEVRTEVDGIWARKYALGYAASDNGTTSLLTTVTQTGRDQDGNVVTLPPETYAYQSGSDTWDNQTSWIVPEPVCADGSNNSYDYGVRFADINGDGLSDIVRSFLDSSEVTHSAVYLHDGTGWLSASWTVPEIISYKSLDRRGVRLVDVNADGLTDLLASFADDSNQKNVYINDGDSWEYDASWVLPFYHVSNSGDQGVRYGDVNGDGLVDVVSSNQSGNSVYLHDGAGWELAASWTVPVAFAANRKDAGGRLIDVNADGLADLLRGYRDTLNRDSKEIYLNTGYGWELYATGTLPVVFTRAGADWGVRFFDVNGDRLVDIVQSHRNSGGTVSKNVYLNTGNLSWELDSSWDVPVLFSDQEANVCTGAVLTDVQGDGLTDILQAYVSATSTQINEKKEELLHAVAYAHGGSTTIEYEQTTQFVDAAENLLNPGLPAVLSVVSMLTHADGLGNTETEQTVYGGGRYYFGGPFDREFVGFATTTATDGLGNVTTTYYHQGNGTQSSLGEYQDHIGKIGKPYRIEKYDDDDNLYETVVNKWDRYALNATSTFVKLARTTTLTYDGDGDHRDSAVEYTYDDSTGSVTNKTEYGEVTAATDGSFTDSGSDKRTTDITYAASSTGYLIAPKQETVKNQSGITVADTKRYYDTLAHGSVTKGNPTKVEQWVVGSTWVETEKTYNGYGLVTSEKDPRDKTTTYTYDAFNLYPATTTTPEGHVTARQYDYSSGKAATTTDPNGFVFVTVYDGLDRPIVEKQPDLDTPSTLVTKTTYEYTDTKAETKLKRTDYFDASTAVDSYRYFDSLGRLIQTRVEAEESNTFAVTDRAYNERGEVARESLPYFSTGAASTSPTTDTNLHITTTYDPLGRTKTVANAVGTTTYAYDQWETVVTDPNGNAKDLHHDAFDRLVEVEEHNDGSTYTTTYGYSPIGTLTSITDALGNVRTFTYDGLGRRVEADDLHASADSTYGTWLYAYDAAGNVSSTTDPNGRTVNYTYDDVNRPLTEDYLGDAGTEVTYGYDTCVNGIGQLCAATTTDTVTAYAYNALGLNENETRTIAGSAYTTSFDYDRQGNVTELTYPDASQVRYTYNTAGQLEQVEHKESGGSYASVVDDIDYGPHGKPVFKAFANDTETTYTYDPAALYRLTNITTEQSTGVLGMFEHAVLEQVKRVKDIFLVLADEIVTPLAEVISPNRSGVVTEEDPEDTPASDAATDDATLQTTDAAGAPADGESLERGTPEAVSSAAEETAGTEPSTEGAADTATGEEDSETAPAASAPAPEQAKDKLSEFPDEVATPFSADGLVESVHDARAWRAYHHDRVKALEASADAPAAALSAARHAQNRYEQFLVSKGYIKAPKEDIKPHKRLMSFLGDQAKYLLALVLPERAYAYVFGTEDFESCGSLPCSFDTNGAWGSVTPSLDHTSQVAGEDSLKEIVSGEGGGGLVKSSLSTNELWAKFKVYVPSNLSFGASGFFSILMFQDGSANDTLWLNVEDWGSTARLTIAGDTVSWTDTGLDLTEGAVNTIQMRVKIGSSNGDVDIWLDNDTEGSPDYNGSGSMNTGTDSIDNVIAGVVYAPESGYGTTYYDDITVDSAFIGAGGGGQGGDTYQDISYTYDAVGNITKIIDNSGTNAAGTTTYAYDDLYRLTGATTTQAASGDNYTRSLSYNAIGNITSKSDVGSYLYQGSSGASYANPHAVTSVDGTTWEYDENGNLTDDGTWSYTYDYRNRLVEASQGGEATSTTSTVVYDDATSWSDWSWDVTTDFNNTSPVYEGSKSIEAAYTAAWGGFYLQKDAGVDVTDLDTVNLAVRTTTTGIELELDLYDDDDEWLGYVSLNDYVPGETFAANTWYDVSVPINALNSSKVAVGGITLMSDTATTVYVDDIRFEGEAAGGGGSATTTRYLYDHNGARTAYFDGTATTTYANKYFDTDGIAPTKHIYGPDGTLLASVEGTGGSAEVKTAHTDHLGGTNVVTDDSGAVEQLLSYYPFGATRIDEQEGTFDERRKFTGHELDFETGLYYMQARYQSPEVGRFASQDPAFWEACSDARLSDPQKQNSYSYVENNPLNKIDPTGLSSMQNWFAFNGNPQLAQYKAQVQRGSMQAVGAIAAAPMAPVVAVGAGMVGRAGLQNPRFAAGTFNVGLNLYADYRDNGTIDKSPGAYAAHFGFGYTGAKFAAGRSLISTVGIAGGTAFTENVVMEGAANLSDVAAEGAGAGFGRAMTTGLSLTPLRSVLSPSTMNVVENAVQALIVAGLFEAGQKEQKTHNMSNE